MANVYTPQSALLMAKSAIKKMPIDSDNNIKFQIMDLPYQMMWYAAPFYWTLSNLPNVTINASATDYVFSSAPTDFLYLHQAYVNTSGSNANILKPVAQLPTTSVQIGNPSEIAIFNSATQARIFPKPPGGYTGTLISQYKKQSTIISSGNYTSTVLAFPDQYVPVYQAGVDYYALRYADDQRAGGCTVDQDGKREYTGQLGVFMAMIWELRAAEKLPLVYPDGPMNRG